MYTRQNLAVGLVLTISMVGISHGVGGNLPGDGLSESTAYLIEDLADFDVFADQANAATYWSSGVHTKLTCDPNLAGRPYTTAVIAPDTPDTDWQFDGIPFEGVFDGNGHIIRNLTIDTVGEGNDFLGLFGRIEGSGAQVKNLGIENINITGGDDSDRLGGLCGVNSGTITNCYATGSIIGDDCLGSLCGGNNDTITNCYATGLVTGGAYSRDLGGLCGYNQFGTIRNCYTTGSVIGRDYSDHLGGLCGYNSSGTITNCYAAGSVTGGISSDYLGGLCGYTSGLITGIISNCYAIGSITGGDDSDYLGGLCGYNKYGTITNCFWDTQTSGMSISDGGTGKTTAQMQMQSTFTDAYWDFTNETANGTNQIWQMTTGSGYPVLSSFNGYTPALLSGDGTEASPYLISDAAQLGAIYHYNSNACFRLQSGVDLTGIQWSTAILPVFGGCFDGNGYVIYNLNIEGDAYLGLFGKISGSGAEVKNLGIENINIAGNNYLGGLCGENRGAITNCYATGLVAGSNCLGVLCGWNYEGTINNCYSTGSVTGSSSLGGLCGRNGGLVTGSITNCYAAGSVTGGDYSHYLGGLCGHNHYGIITNCYATGSVTGGDDSNNLGGLCGWNDKGTITDCYATGSVTGGFGSRYLGGLCGYNRDGTISNCFWDIETGGPDNGLGTPKTTAEMQMESTFTDANWDFSVVPLWHMPFEAIGYPMLGWQKDIPGDFTGRYGVYMDDFAIFSNAWLSDDTPTTNWNEHCDLDSNGVIDPGDLKTFAEHWLCK